MGILQKSDTENYTCRLDIVQNLREFCLILWAKNVLIPPDQHVLIPSDQNMSILFVNDIYWEY